MNEVLKTPGYYRQEDHSSVLWVVALSDLIVERDAERERVSEIVKDCLPSHPGVYLPVQQWETLASLILPDPEPTPEELLMREARKIVADVYTEREYHEMATWLLEGSHDNAIEIQVALSALKRGSELELAKVIGGSYG